MPGSNVRALDKARVIPADVLILDLEDAVAPLAKDEARLRVRHVFMEGGYGHRELVVRVNGLDTPWGERDLYEVATMGADAVLLPKVNCAADVTAAVAELIELGAAEDQAIWCMMETPAGILNAAEIAQHPSVQCLVMGTSDLAEALSVPHTLSRLGLLHSLGACVLAARSAGIAIIDGVHLDLSDDAGFASACEQGVELGFDGKTLIHPKTVEVANDIFGPSAAAILWAERVIAAHGAAEAEGTGVVLLDGKLIENLHVEGARRTLETAEAIAERG